jgi:hypothetical protein
MKGSKASKSTLLPDRSNYAYASLGLGLLSILSAYFVMITLGIIMALSGMVYAFVARDSRQKRFAQIGALISLFGLVASLLAGGII